MTIREPFALRHVGTDTDAEPRVRQPMHGCAFARKFFEEIEKVKFKPGVAAPRECEDDHVDVIGDNVPEGTEPLRLPQDVAKLS